MNHLSNIGNHQGVQHKDYSDSELTDDQNHFIAYDIRPRDSKQLQYYRFAYEYDNPKRYFKRVGTLQKNI